MTLAAAGGVTPRQAAFLLASKKRRRMVTFMRIFLLILFLAVWELCSDLDVIDAFFFSSPSRVAVNFITLLRENSLLTHIGITLYETLLSFLLVFLISMICATVLWYSTRLSEIVEPYLVVLNSLPKSALAPLLIVWLGTGMNTIIVAGMSVALFGAIISLYTGFRQVDEEKIRLIYTLGGSRKDSLFKVVLPGSIPIILSTMKVNIGLALVGVVIGEFLAARRGLGYLIIYGSQVFKLDMVITSILILCVIAMGLYQVIQGVEKFYKKRL
ncbi:MAG TPA: ABC transporter permease [Candidatus Eisenbergiella merdipullorum]|uniref:ABC transporter permease n=1 Tax=Candidatus Eisenbergiella merdipullorum TaxID=2838553 RepID=A0A9D2I7A1_9FIRM|nr:ABC transporter permease [Candidatus Eisenbergiella merdipullorum]